MRVSELEVGSVCDSLVALAQDWKIMRVEGNEGRVIISKTGRNIDYLYKGHTCLEMLNSGKTLYTPSQGNQQTYALINTGIAVEGNSAWAWKDGICIGYIGATPAEAICKVKIALKWSNEIPDEIMEQVI